MLNRNIKKFIRELHRCSELCDQSQIGKQFSIDTSSELSAKDTTITLKVLNDNGTLARIVREPIAE